MPQDKPFNPFYPALVVVGTAFAISACAYGVMTVRKLDPMAGDDRGLVEFLDEYGLVLLVGELIVLGLLTFAAIGSDDYWTRRFEARHKQRDEERPE